MAAGEDRQTLRERLGALRHLPRFVRLVWQASPGLTLASVALRLGRALLPLAILYVGKLIVDEVSAQARLPSPGADPAAWWSSGRLDALGLLLLTELGLALLSDLLARANALVDALIAELYGASASIRVMEHAATLDLSDFENSERQDGIERARRQAGGRGALLGQAFAQGQDILTILALAAGLAAYAPFLVLLLAAAQLPALLGEAHFNTAAYRLQYRRAGERRQLDYLRYLGASVEHAKEVKLFDISSFLIERFRGLTEALYRATRSLAVRRAVWGGLFAGVGTAAYYGAYAFVVWRTATGAFSLGDLTFVAGSLLRLRGLLEGLLLGLSQIASQALYLNDLFSFFELQPRITSPAAPRPLPATFAEGFVFDDVGFRYPGSDRWAVRHLGFALPAGEVLALVGENGAGKTTIVKLLTRLYDPDEGRILLEGRDLREYDVHELRARIGVIFQDFVRYNLSAGENVGVGRIEARDDENRIRAAAERSRADEVVARLPAGYAQPLGRRFHDGVDLSGGEWQKIALARAYMRDADLLVLDEPTAALDARAEFEVFRRFRELSRGRTALLISHRFSTVRIADRILVLDGGRVLEGGSHAELLRAGGRYAELFELQAAGYR